MNQATPDDEQHGRASAAGETAPDRGVLDTHVDRERGIIQIDYDPDRVSDDQIAALARQLRPELDRRFHRLPLRLRGSACEAAAMRLEQKAERVPGVRRATASFNASIMSITFDQGVIDEDDVEARVRAMGAPVSRYEPEPEESPTPSGMMERVRHVLTGDRLAVVFVVLTLLGMLAGWLAPRMLGNGVAAMWISAASFTVAYVTGGTFAIRSAWASLRQLTIDVDLLMILAALGAAYVGNPFEGALLLFLFSLSNVLQTFAMARTRRAIRSLMKLRPSNALTRRNGGTVLLPIERLDIGDRVIVRPGESIPLDGVIVEGESTIDESSLTGESMPVTRRVGEDVFAATINQGGGLEIEVTRLARDSTIARLINLVEVAQSERAPTQRFIDRFGQYYALSVIALTIGLILAPILLLGAEFAATFYRAITVMVVASPCAIIISTPASILSAIGGAARQGVLFKGGAHIERTAAVRIVAIDKTGTLTEGRPRVTDLVTASSSGSTDSQLDQTLDEQAREVLRLAAGVEGRSEHPLARAIVNFAEEQRIDVPPCTGFQSDPGRGASAIVDGRRISVGNLRYFDESPPDDLQTNLTQLHRLQSEGKTSLLVVEHDPAGNGRGLGVIAVADTLRPDAPAVVRELKSLGIDQVVMLTGDNERVAMAIAREAGIDEVHAELLPEDKVRVIRELAAHAPVAMVGDGVNDAPALAAASVGIAMGGAGTDVAMETADVVLMRDNLARIPFAIALSRSARRIVTQNLVFALSVIILLVIVTLGFELPLPLGVVGHEGSTVLVVLNGLRLLAFRGGPDAGHG